MKNRRILLAAALLLALSVNSQAEAPPVATPTAQSLYLQAGKHERQGETTKAREAYEQIIDRFPESDFAVKANDRLLVMPAATGKVTAHPVTPLAELHKATPTPVPPNTPAAAQTTTPGPQKAEPASGLDALFAPSELKPLPTDPQKRRGVELVRLFQKAQVIRREETSKRQRAFNVQYGRHYSRTTLANEQVRWEEEAELKVRSELGRSSGEIEQELATVCGQLGLPPKCGEDEITR